MNNTKEQIEKLTRGMKKSSDSINRGSTQLLIVAFCLFALSIGYFTFGYYQFRDVTKPENVVLIAQGVVDDNIAVLRANLQSEVNKNSDTWAEQLSDAAIKSVPNMRKQLEDFVSLQIDERVKQSIDVTNPEFEKFVSQNNEPLKKAFSDLAGNAEVSDELVEIISNEVDRRLQTSIQSDAENVLNLMVQLKAKIRKLEKGVNLTEEEKLEREILATTRFIQESEMK